MPIELQAALPIEQSAAECALQQAEPFKRLYQRDLRRLAVGGCPSGLNLADPLDHHRVAIAVRAAVQRQPDPDRRIVVRRKQQAIGAKVIERQAIRPDIAQHWREARHRFDLARKDVMALQTRIIAREFAPIDRAK